MLTEKERTGCHRFLQEFQSHELLSLVETVTNRMITVQNKKDAISAIIQHSDSALELLRRRKVRKECIFRHLAAEQVTASPNADKETLVQQLLSHWETRGPQRAVPSSPITTVVRQNGDHQVRASQSPGSQGSDLQQPIHVQTLAVEFTTWFFKQLNSLGPVAAFAGPASPPDWGPQHFWADSRLALRIAASEERREAFEGAELVARRLEGFVREEGLLFNPNVSPDGVRGWNEAHGLVNVGACGTVHRGGACVGLFEQQVGLIRDPLCQNIWKIKFVQLSMKQA